MHATTRRRPLRALVPALALLAATAVDGGARAAEYLVQSGDTLWEISRRHGCTVDGLRERTHLGESQALRVARLLGPGGCTRAPAAGEARP